MHKYSVFTLLLVSLFSSGCFYVHSSYQSAKLLPEGEIEVVPYYQSEQYKEGSSTNDAAQYGVQVALGTNRGINFRLRYERLDPDGMDPYSYLGLGPKFGSQNGKVAFDVPLGLFFGDGIDENKSFQIHPTAIFSHSFSKTFEVTGFAKYIYFFDEGSENLHSFGLGAGITNSDGSITIRPEYSRLYHPDLDGYYSSLGVGVAFRVGTSSR